MISIQLAYVRAGGGRYADELEAEMALLEILREERNHLLEEVSRLRSQRGYLARSVAALRRLFRAQQASPVSTWDRLFRVQPTFVPDGDNPFRSEQREFWDAEEGLDELGELWDDEDGGVAVTTPAPLSLNELFEQERRAGNFPPLPGMLSHAHPPIVRDFGYPVPPNTIQPTPPTGGTANEELVRQRILDFAPPHQRSNTREVPPVHREEMNRPGELPLLYPNLPARVRYSPVDRTLNLDFIPQSHENVRASFRQLHTAVCNGLEQMQDTITIGDLLGHGPFERYYDDPLYNEGFDRVGDQVALWIAEMTRIVRFFAHADDPVMAQVGFLENYWTRLNDHYMQMLARISPNAGATDTTADGATRVLLMTTPPLVSSELQTNHQQQLDARRTYTPGELRNIRRVSAGLPSVRFVFSNGRERENASVGQPTTPPESPARLATITEDIANESPLSQVRQQVVLDQEYPHSTTPHERVATTQAIDTPAGINMQVSRFSCDPRTISYFVRIDNNDPGLALATFNWQGATVGHFYQLTLPADDQLRSTMQVHVENAVHFGLGLGHLDQLVWYEIETAAHMGLVEEELAENLWGAWCGRGDEVMQFGDVVDLGSP